MIIIIFVIQSKFTGWYGSGLWHELSTIEILVMPGQTSAWAGDVTLLSWREWWEDITELGWLTLCSPPQAENGCMFEDCLYWGGGCQLFKDINNCAILASCWRSFCASLTRNSSNLRSLSALSFNWHSNLLSCAVIEAFIPRAIASKPCVVDLIFSDFLCGGLAIFDFFRNGGLSACLTFWWIPLGASSSTCLSSASSHWDQCHQIYWNLQACFHNRRHYHAFPGRSLKNFLFMNEATAALDTKFNGLCISAKTGFKI